MESMSAGVFVALYALLGLGLPIGVPPLPEDAALAQIAPEDSLVYFSSYGMAAPDGKSDNLTEQFMANDEIQQFAASIEKAIQTGLAKQLPPGRVPFTSDEIVFVAKTVLTRPWTLYVGMVTPPMGPNQPPYVQAGLGVNLGDRQDRFQEIFNKLTAALPLQKQEIDGKTWYSLPANPNLPEIKFGVYKNYFLFASGRDEMDNLLGRMEGTPAAWLKTLQEKLPVERRATFGYVNVQKIRTLYLPLVDLAAGGRVSQVIEGLGLNQIPAVLFSSGLEEKGLVNKVMVCSEGEPSGLLAQQTEKSITLDDLKKIPGDASFASIGEMNLGGLYDLVTTIVKKVGPKEYAEMQKDIGDAEKTLGLKIRDDILASFGDRLVVYDSPSGGGALIGTTVILGVKDQQKAEKVVAALHRLLAQFVASEAAKNQNRSPRTIPSKIETLDVNGVKIYCLNVGEHGFPITPSWCLTKDQLILGATPQTVKAALAGKNLGTTLANMPEVTRFMKKSDRMGSFSYQNANRGFDVVYLYLVLASKIASTELRYNGIDWNPASLPTATAFKPYLSPCVSIVHWTKNGLIYETHQSVPGTAILGAMPEVGPITVALLLPAVQAARTAARRAQSSNNLKQFGLALLTYHDANRKFPAAYTADKNGKPLLSWRVYILPFMEYSSLYEQFHLDEPWDSEHNKKLLSQMPQEFRSPQSNAEPNKTTYLGVRGKHAFFVGNQGIRIGDIQDGASHTIAVVETDDQHAVEWTKPDDWEYGEENPKDGLTGTWPNVFLALFVDGSVRAIPTSIDGEALKALFTRDGNEPVPALD